MNPEILIPLVAILAPFVFLTVVVVTGMLTKQKRRESEALTQREVESLATLDRSLTRLEKRIDALETVIKENQHNVSQHP